MSIIENILIIGALSVPIIALIAVKPRFKKHLIPPETMPYTSTDKDKEEKKEIINDQPVQREKIIDNDLDSLDFKDYLKEKKSKTALPKRNVLLDGFEDRTMPYRRHENKGNQENKSVKDQINSLSPEVLTIILSGTLDRRYFD